MKRELTFEDLVDYSGLTPRTLRFYMQEGILQGPDTHGKFSRYSQQHLDRLELIQRLKNLRLPIKEIRHLIENMTPEEISEVRSYQDKLNPNLNRMISEPVINLEQTKPGSSALDYIRNLEHGQESIESITKASTKSPFAPKPLDNNFRGDAHSPNQETWKRFVINDGIEINIRESIEMDQGQKVKKLIEFAQVLFENHS